MLKDTNREPPALVSLERIVDSMLSDLHVAMPGVIEKYDPSTQLADVQPIFKRVFLNDDDTENPITYPVIPDVPVAFPQGGNAYLTFPLAKGDRVLLIFSQRSLDGWKETDGKTIIDPVDSRRHHVTDAMAIPGLATARNPIANVSGSDVVLGTSGGAKVILGSAGANSPGDAFVRQSDLQAYHNQYVATHIHTHPMGPTGTPVNTSFTPSASSVCFGQ